MILDALHASYHYFQLQISSILKNEFKKLNSIIKRSIVRTHET